MAPPNENTGLALDEVVVVVAAGAAADPKENVDPEVALVVAADEAAGAAPPKLKAGAGFVVSVEVLVQVWSLTELCSVAFLQSGIISDMCFYNQVLCSLFWAVDRPLRLACHT